MSTVSIGSNQKYAENWDAIFKKGKGKKKAAPAKSGGKAKKAAAAKKKAGSKKSKRKTARKS